MLALEMLSDYGVVRSARIDARIRRYRARFCNQTIPGLLLDLFVAKQKGSALVNRAEPILINHQDSRSNNGCACETIVHGMFLSIENRVDESDAGGGER